MNVSSIELLDILQNARIEEPKAKAIIRAIEVVGEQRELSLREYMEKHLMHKTDGMELENRLIKWTFGLLVSQALVVLGGAYFLITHSKF